MSDLNSAIEKMNSLQKSVGVPTSGQPWTEHIVEFLTVSVLLFSAAAICVAGLLLWRSTATTPGSILKLIGILSIIGLSTLLLVVGYSNEQLTPIVGLFGAIAGYLLGKDSQVQPPQSGASS